MLGEELIRYFRDRSVVFYVSPIERSTGGALRANACPPSPIECWENEGGSTRRSFPLTRHICCGTACFMDYQATLERPCWGDIQCVDTVYDEETNDEYRYGACEGHYSMWLSGEYEYPEEVIWE